MINHRVMAIDYGGRRIGIAISDPLQLIAYPYKTIDRKKSSNYIDDIKKIIKEKDVKSVVVGYPLTMSGNESEQTKLTLEFIEILKSKVDIEIHKCDERLSSQEAKRYLRQQNIKIGHNKEKIDKVSASIILDQFLSTIK